jgi:hypothetical protein
MFGVKKWVIGVVCAVSSALCYGRIVSHKPLSKEVPYKYFVLLGGGGAPVEEEVLTPKEHYEKGMRLLARGHDDDGLHELLQANLNEFRPVFLIGLWYHYNSKDDCGVTAPQTWDLGQRYMDEAFRLLWLRVYAAAWQESVAVLSPCDRVVSLRLQRDKLYKSVCDSWSKHVQLQTLLDALFHYPVLSYDVALYMRYMEGESVKTLVRELLRVELAPLPPVVEPRAIPVIEYVD